MTSKDEIIKSFYALAEILEEYFTVNQRLSANFLQKVTADGSCELVSNIDIEIEDICTNYLKTLFPSIPVIGEEQYKQGDSLPDEGWAFIIDPIDGTTEFLLGSSDWTISLAASLDLTPTVGLILMPKTKMIFSACRNEGVIFNHKRLYPMQDRLGGGKIAVSPRQIVLPEYAEKINWIGLEPISVPTVTVKIISILLGKTDAAIYFAQEGSSAKIWDYAAATLLIQEFGGRITSLDGTLLPFSGTDLIHKDGWIATSMNLNHEEILEKLKMGR